MDEEVLELAGRAKAASRILGATSESMRNNALLSMAEALIGATTSVMEANSIDLAAARSAALSASLLDRLTLTPARVLTMAEGLKQIARLPDPVGEILEEKILSNGLQLLKMRVPIGVIGIIYESRPNVTVDSAGLCLKSGNAVVLRGGSESINTNIELARTISSAATLAGLPAGTIQLISSTDRGAALTLMQAEGLVDLLIPRGGEGLKKTVIQNARVPVLTSLGGNCHTFVDDSADLQMASDIAFNAKVSRPSVCNAMETLLVHRGIAMALLPSLVTRLQDAGVEVRGCERTRTICPLVKAADETDWATEYADLILAIRIVDTLEEAMEHIDRYGTGHSEAIITRDTCNANDFTSHIDAACVYINASTRFTDGFEFGMGAEVGISTQKLHARGPVGLRELTTYKTIVTGNGQIRV